MLWKRAIQKVSKKSFDHIIVGAGSAGCVLANRLTEDGTRSVLLIEAGPKDTTLFDNELGKLLKWQIHMPTGMVVNYEGNAPTMVDNGTLTIPCESAALALYLSS